MIEERRDEIEEEAAEEVEGHGFTTSTTIKPRPTWKPKAEGEAEEKAEVEGHGFTATTTIKPRPTWKP
jgi:hypothetical protein